MTEEVRDVTEHDVTSGAAAASLRPQSADSWFLELPTLIDADLRARFL